MMYFHLVLKAYLNLFQCFLPACNELSLVMYNLPPIIYGISHTCTVCKCKKASMLSVVTGNGGGCGTHNDMVYKICACLLGRSFTEFCIVMEGVYLMKASDFHK